jgi:hypothetical protein
LRIADVGSEAKRSRVSGGLCSRSLLLGHQALHDSRSFTSVDSAYGTFSQMAWYGFLLPYGLSHWKRQFAEILAIL